MITCGFFNAVNGDRTYNAEQMNNPYKRIVSNGVFAKGDGTQSDDMKVIADGTMTLKVSKGDGIFDGKWAQIDAPYNATIQTPDVSNARIDSIVFSVDYTNRQGIIGVVKGTPAVNPVPPSIMRSNVRMDYRLANVRVAANATGITQADVTDTRAGADCGFITSLLLQPDITAIYDQWQTQFEDWFQDVKETLSTSTLIRSYASHYVTATQGETEIPINITQFNKNLDILQVFVNGLRLIPDEEYTIDSNEQITLTADVDINTPISFIVYKSVDGSEAESVVTQVYQLQQIQLTSNSGAVKRAMFSGDLLSTFKSLGVGIHTILASDAVTNTPTTGQYWRCIGHLTDVPYGWIIAISGEGKAYINFATGASTWAGWKELTNSQSPVSENGGVKISVAAGSNVLDAFRNAGTGFHTLYAAYNSTGVPVVGAYRLFGHMSAPTYGWIIAVKADASAWINYLDNGVWQGWKVLHEETPAALYVTPAGQFPVAGLTVTPSKPLSECQHGWQLIFTGYNDTDREAKDYYTQSILIPKRSYKNAEWNGESWTFPLVYSYNQGTDENLICTKTFTVYDNRFVSSTYNSQGKSRNMVLRAVYEY